MLLADTVGVCGIAVLLGRGVGSGLSVGGIVDIGVLGGRIVGTVVLVETDVGSGTTLTTLP
jgi:hypothetical protein